MIKDIPTYVVEDIAIAVVRELNEDDEVEWNVYMLNLKDREIEGVLVTSNGYGEVNGEKVKTSTLRHFLDTIPAKGFSKIEPIIENVFGLSNEYWVSFYLDKVMYDKRYIFLAESIKEDHFVNIPLLNKKGVMIR
jgi:hypothetical protein